MCTHLFQGFTHKSLAIQHTLYFPFSCSKCLIPYYKLHHRSHLGNLNRVSLNTFCNSFERSLVLQSKRMRLKTEVDLYARSCDSLRWLYLLGFVDMNRFKMNLSVPGGGYEETCLSQQCVDTTKYPCYVSWHTRNALSLVSFPLYARSA